MTVKRRTNNNRRSGKRNASSGIPAWLWLLGGILIGLGMAVFLMFQGYLPELKQHLPSVIDGNTGSADPALLEDNGKEADKPKKPRYDFFTVLPEMEVVVPEQELSRQAGPPDEMAPGGTLDNYILQAGSFRNAKDAEQLKATLALLGSIATVHTVTVNGETWHRVRIGPYEGARKADEMRRMLSDNNIDTLVLKVNP
jgi:cell division septation protein DedD